MRPPLDPLSCEIGSLAELWLSIRCPRGRSLDYPFKLMAMRHPLKLTLGQLVPRLICTCCRQRPASVVLAETPYAPGLGRAGADCGWKLDILQLMQDREGIGGGRKARRHRG